MRLGKAGRRHKWILCQDHAKNHRVSGRWLPIPRARCRIILEPKSHEPGSRVESIRGHSHEPGKRQMANFVACQSHDPGTVTPIARPSGTAKFFLGPGKPPFSPPPRSTAHARGRRRARYRRALARGASAPAASRAWTADWTHFSDWCAANGFPACRARSSSAATSPAPPKPTRRLPSGDYSPHWERCPATTICRGMPPAHGATQGPLPARQATQKRPRAVRLRRCAAPLQTSFCRGVKVDANGLRPRILRGKTDLEGKEPEIGLPHGKCVEPVRRGRLRRGRR
jgi:hypothetical protein